MPATCGPKKSTNAISMERIEELQRKRIVAKQEMLKKKRALDELQMAECTFRPQISKGNVLFFVLGCVLYLVNVQCQANAIK